MGAKITKYPNMLILPNDGIKFRCDCGCEFVAIVTTACLHCDSNRNKKQCTKHNR